MPTPSLSLAFTSDRFDHTSELPSDFNAGNRFYGKDVAAYLAEQLTASGLPAGYDDEDWGWLVFGARGTEPDFDVAIYNLSEHREGGRPGANRWGLWVQQYARRKLLGILPQRSEVPVSQKVEAAVRAAITAAGSQPQPWDEDEGTGA